MTEFFKMLSLIPENLLETKLLVLWEGQRCCCCDNHHHNIWVAPAAPEGDGGDKDMPVQLLYQRILNSQYPQ
jgi:hypothetical protein